MAKNHGTDGSLLQSLPWTLIAVGFAVLPHVAHVPIWITGAFLICAIGRLHIEKRRKRLPPATLRVALALLAFLGVLGTYENITGVGPGSALLVVMAALKLMETRRRRDQFVLLFISIFLIMSALLREQAIWSMPFLLVGCAITMTAWLRMSAGPEVSIKRNLATSSRLLLIAAPLTLAMWIFFPRLSSPFWAVPVDSGRAKSGLSNTMNPGDISSLSLSNKVAFRVDFQSAVPPPEQLYWRGLVLHIFNGRSWKGNDVPQANRGPLPIDYLGDPVQYQMTMEPTAQHWIYALDAPYKVELNNITMGRQLQLARRRPVDQRISFSAVSYTQYRTDVNPDLLRRSFYRRLPQNSNRQTVALAAQMRAAAANEEQYIENVLRMFNEEDYYYTLEPPALGNNPVDRFLFDTRQGFCEHYASAFAVLMRAAGIPARIVLGYQGGEFNALGEYLIVRQADAHAWTEVWLAGRGWTRVDPTAAVAPERISAGISGVMFDPIGASWGLNAPSIVLHKLTLAWDALNAKWNEWILGYGPENQNRFMQWLGMDDPDWRQMMLTLVAIVAVIVGVISLLLMLRHRPPPKDDAALLYAKFTSRVGIEPATGETPYAYAKRISRADASAQPAAATITEQYLTTRYGPPNPQSLQALRESVSRFPRG